MFGFGFCPFAFSLPPARHADPMPSSAAANLPALRMVIGKGGRSLHRQQAGLRWRTRTSGGGCMTRRASRVEGEGDCQGWAGVAVGAL